MDEEDLKSISYPKYVKFGYGSLIIFAILGVILPLTYRWWQVYLLNHSEIFGLGAFSIGLILTLLYLGYLQKNCRINPETRKDVLLQLRI